MRNAYVRTSRKLIALNLVLFLGFALIGSNLVHSPVYAEECPQTITLKSGNGTICSPDSEVEFFDTNTATFVPALVVDPNALFFAYDTIPGTQWNALDCNRAGSPGTHYTYRTKFTLPECFISPSLSIQVHCDNRATAFLNGVEIGAQPDVGDNPSNFQNPPEVISTSNASLFQTGENILSFDVFEVSAGITALDFKADVCFGVTQCEEVCGSCNQGVVVVDQNVTVDLNPAVPTCSGDPDLCAFFTPSKPPATSPSNWKAIFNVGANKLLVKNGATITVVPGPPNGGNNKESPGIEIRSTCEVQIDSGAAVVVQSINRQAGDIFIQADGNVTVNGTVSNSVAGTNGRPGEITIASCCGNILTGPQSLIQTFGSDHGGSDINLLACDRGNITINGLVEASYKGASAATINIAAFGGAVTIDGTTLQGIEAGTQRRITSGVVVRSRRDPLAGKIFIQALNDVTVIGNSILSKLYPNYGAVAVKPTSTNGSSGDGSIFAESLQGKIVASDRAFDIANRFNGLNDITLLANGNILLSVTASIDNGAVNNTKAVVNSQGGSDGKGGNNGLRSYAGQIQIGVNAQVLANFTGTPGLNGTNTFTTCLGVINNGIVLPAAAVVTSCDPGPTPVFSGCDQFNVACLNRQP